MQAGISATRAAAPATLELMVSGMTCGGCVNAVTRVLLGVPGVASAAVDLASGTATVTGTAGVQDLIHAVESAAFEGRPSGG